MNAQARVHGMPEGDHVDFDYLRSEIRKCFYVDMPKSSSDIGDFGNVKGDMVLKPPSQTYTREAKDRLGRTIEVKRRKPAHGQWTTTTHATASQRPGFSRPVISDRDYSKAKYARAISRLDADHVQVIHAKYHSSPKVRTDARDALAQNLATRHHKEEKIQVIARMAAAGVLSGVLNHLEVMRLMGIKLKPESNGYMVKVCRQMSRRIQELDECALLAWDAQCLKLDL